MQKKEIITIAILITVLFIGNVTSLLFAQQPRLPNRAIFSVNQGGTGTSTFSNGGIVFSDGITLKQDTTNLFWDDVNNRLGIGTTTGTAYITIEPTTESAADNAFRIESYQDGFSRGLFYSNDTDQNSLVIYDNDNGNLYPSLYISSSTPPTTAGALSYEDYVELVYDGKGNVTSVFPAAVFNTDALGYLFVDVDQNNLFSIMDGGAVGSTVATGSSTASHFVANSGSATSTFAGEVRIEEDKGLRFSTQEDFNFKFSTDHGKLLYTGDEINFPEELVFVANTGKGASGVYSPFIDFDKTGLLQLVADGNTNDQVILIGTDGVIISSKTSGAQAIYKDTNVSGSNKTFEVPNHSGTFTLLEASQTFTGLNKFEASANSTVYIGSVSKTGCLVMGDSDGVGVSYVTVNDGVLSATTTKPSICQ